MICISVTPESRQLAKVDMLNAARQADMVELCLDRLLKPPDVKDILSAVNKPVMVSCRRQEEGGQWRGNEEQRLTLLREAIVAEPAFIELELDVGLHIPRYGKTKRVISYTRTDRPLSDIEDIFTEASKLHADVVKFTWPTPTLEAAWPLLAAVSKKREIPVVGMGLGSAGVTFSLLGRKYGSPWIYAALEKGMEGYEGQPTVHELDDIHHWREIDGKTQFVGIVGLGESELTTVRIFNEAFLQFGTNARCLPLAVGSFDRLAKMLEVLKIRSLITSRSLGEHVLPLAEKLEDRAQAGQYADLLLHQKDGWNAYNSIWRSAIRVLEHKYAQWQPGDTPDRPLTGLNFLVVGHTGLAQTMIAAISRRGGLVSVTGRDDNETRKVAQQFDARFLPFSNFYDAYNDIVVFADPQLKMGTMRGQFNPGYLRETMTVIDVGWMPGDSFFVKSARQRGCRVVEPKDVYIDQISMQFKSVTGKDLPLEAVEKVLSETE